MDEESEKHVQACKEWIARQTARLDQTQKRNEVVHPAFPPREQLEALDRLEAGRFWVDIHRWELDEMIQTGSIDDYPQKTEND